MNSENCDYGLTVDLFTPQQIKTMEHLYTLHGGSFADTLGSAIKMSLITEPDLLPALRLLEHIGRRGQKTH